MTAAETNPPPGTPGSPPDATPELAHSPLRNVAQPPSHLQPPPHSDSSAGAAPYPAIPTCPPVGASYLPTGSYSYPPQGSYPAPGPSPPPGSYSNLSGSHSPSPYTDSSSHAPYPAQQYNPPQYPAPHYPAPQYPAPQYPAPQYPAPQYPAPQYHAPQYTAPTSIPLSPPRGPSTPQSPPRPPVSEGSYKPPPPVYMPYKFDSDEDQPGSCVADAAQDMEYGTTVATCSARIRNRFIAKVYLILLMQLTFTVGIVCMFMFIKPLNEWVAYNGWFIWVMLIPAIILLFVIPLVAHKHPWNYVLLFALTVLESMGIGAICGFYEYNGWGYTVLQAFILTATVFVSITAFCLLTRIDFSFLRTFLFAACMIVFMAAMLNFVIGMAGAYNHWASFAISIAFALVIAGYILYDTSSIIRKYSIDDYILAAQSLYTDFAALFLAFLGVMSTTN